MILKKEKYTTKNKDYNIEIIKKKLYLDNNIMYIINIMDIFDNIIVQLNLSDIDILKLIDNIEYFSYNDIDIQYSCNTNNITYIIEFSQLNIDNEYIHKLEDYYSKDIITIYSFNGDIVTKLLYFDIDNCINNIIDILYKFYKI